MPRWPGTPEERFWGRFDITDTCWLWTGTLSGLPLDPDHQEATRAFEAWYARQAPASPEPTGADEALLAAIVNGPKNGEECPLCNGDSDSQCLYHRGYDDAFPLAARPVLSREALRIRLDLHWPTSWGCTCGENFGAVETFAQAQAQWRDHLAAVLDTQEADDRG